MNFLYGRIIWLDFSLYLDNTYTKLSIKSIKYHCKRHAMILGLTDFTAIYLMHRLEIMISNNTCFVVQAKNKLTYLKLITYVRWSMLHTASYNHRLI